MTFRLLTIYQEMLEIAAKGATFKRLGKVALETIVARYEIENGNYSQEDRTKKLGYLNEVEKAIRQLVPSAIVIEQERLSPTKYSYPSISLYWR